MVEAGRDDLELPEGPVTMMFTDIEGSTALRTSLGDAAADVVFGQHAEIVGEQIRAHRGHDLEAALGDGFLAVFASTRRAIACAVAVQIELERFNRGRAAAPLRVRIGLNTGEVAWQKGQPSGEAVHAAARICAAGSGGEVFVSDVTRQLAGTIPDVTFADRGKFQLKGFADPCRLWSLSWRVPRPEQIREVFVGRDRELVELRSRLAEAMAGRGGLVLVGGEPGVGKTSLVRQMIKEAEQQGAMALFGRCYESEGTVPYSPFVESTEQALRIVPHEWVREDLGEDGPEVARMVPELRRQFPDIGDPLDLPPEQQRRYFFSAITRFITRAAKRLPIVLVVDDIHWADEPTLLLVEHVAELLPHLPVLAIGTYRDVELDVSRPLAATLERLVRARVAARMGLKRFDRRGVTEILEAQVGTAVSAGLVDTIYAETEGNPFFVSEVLHHLDEEGKLFDEAGRLRSAEEIGALDVPESVRLVVGRRVERLGPDGQRVLAAAAVVGRGFEFELLERIAGVDVGDLLDVVDAAERARVIIPEVRGSQVCYTFGHELIRQTLLASLSSPRRQRLHLAVADALELLDPVSAESRPSEIAAHLVQAGSAADPDRTVRLLKRAAERAFSAAAFEEVLRTVESALSVFPPGGDERTRLELLELCGWAQRALGRFEACIEVWDEVVDGYVKLGELEAAGRLLWDIGYHQIWQGRFDAAAAAYLRGLSILDDRPVAERAALMGALGALSGLAGFLEVSEGHFVEAIEIATRIDATHELGRLHWGRSVAYFSNHRWRQALDDGRRATELLRQVGDLWTLVDALGWHGLPLVVTGHPTEARAVAAEAVELGDKLGHRTGAALARRVVALAEGLTGHITSGNMIAQARADLQAMEEMELPWVSQSHAWLSILLTLEGELDGGLVEADLAVASEPLSGFSGIAAGFRFLNRAYAGDGPACRRMLEEHGPALSLDLAEMGVGAVVLLSEVVEGCALLGWAEPIEPLYPVIAEIARLEANRPFDLASGRRVAGMAAMTLERWADARQHLETALHALETTPNEFDKPLVLHRCAELALRMPAEAGSLDPRALLEQAIQGYRSSGKTLLLSSAENLSRALV